MDAVVVSIRLGQLGLSLQERIETLALTQLENLVHLDRFKGTNLHANLTAHADGNVDVEDRRIKLRLAHVVGLLVFALNNIDALRRAFFLADLARNAAQTGLRIIGVEDKEGKVAIILRQRNALLGILHGDQAILLEITSDEVPRRDGHAFENPCADHRSFNVAETASYLQGKGGVKYDRT